MWHHYIMDQEVNLRINHLIHSISFSLFINSLTIKGFSLFSHDFSVNFDPSEHIS